MPEIVGQHGVWQQDCDHALKRPLEACFLYLYVMMWCPHDLLTYYTNVVACNGTNGDTWVDSSNVASFNGCTIINGSIQITQTTFDGYSLHTLKISVYPRIFLVACFCTFERRNMGPGFIIPSIYTDTNVYGTDSVKIWKTRHKYTRIYGYFYSVHHLLLIVL